MFSKIKAFLSKNKKRNIIIALVAVVIVVVLKLTIFSSAPAPTYQTAQVTKGTLVSSVTDSGQVAVGSRVAVTTGASGVISNIYVKSGDSVKQGDTIADVTLDISGQQKQAQALASYLSSQNSLNSAQAKINSLQSSLFVANQAFLNDRGVINPSTDQKNDPKYIEENATWLQAEADYKNQSNVIAQAQVSVSNAWLSYQAVSSKIVAPTSGTITDLIITSGMQIGSLSETSGGTSAGTSLQTVANIKTEGIPTISVSLSEIDVAKVKADDKATITFDALPNQTFTGKVIGINTTGAVASGVTSYPATIQLDSSNDSILPNMSATASIITSIKDNVLLVPTGAVQTTGGQSTVRVLKNGQMTVVPVTVGDSSDTQTEIASGLSEGDIVVIGFVPTTSSSSSTSSPFGSTNLLRGLGGGGGFGGGGAGGGARTGGGAATTTGGARTGATTTGN